MFQKTSAELVKNTSTVSPTTLPTVKDALDNLQGRAPTSLPVPVTEGGTGLTSVGSSGTVLGSTGTALNYVAARELLTAGRTYYVRTDGSNSNNGLTNNSAGAFLTIAKAVAVVQSLDRATFDVSIQIGAGTWTVPVVINGWGPGTGTVTLLGDTTTPSNVTVSVTGAAFSFTGGTTYLKGFKVVASTYGVFVSGYAQVNITGAMEYGACTLAHIWEEVFASVNVSVGANYTISGAAARHWDLRSAHTSLVCRLLTITITGTPAFTTFCNALFFANATVDNITFSGSATGQRYSAQLNSIIYTAGAGATYLPGSSAGGVATQGQYV